MSVFEFNVKFEKKSVMKAKINDLDEIEPIVDKLKEKFNGRN